MPPLCQLQCLGALLCMKLCWHNLPRPMYDWSLTRGSGEGWVNSIKHMCILESGYYTPLLHNELINMFPYIHWHHTSFEIKHSLKFYRQLYTNRHLSISLYHILRNTETTHPVAKSVKLWLLQIRLAF